MIVTVYYYIIFVFKRGEIIIKKYIFIGYGELVLDKIYNENLDLVKKSGGCPVFNVSYNLGLMGENVFAVGGVGNDDNGKKAVNSLNSVGVKTEKLQKLNKPTNINHIIIPNKIVGDNDVKIFQESPITGVKSFELSNSLSTNVPDELCEEDTIVVVSNFQQSTFEFIKNCKEKCKNCKVAMDIGSSMFFKNLDEEYIKEFLENIDIVQLNQKCLTDLYKKIKIDSDITFFDKFNLDLFIVTNGHKGANYIFRDDNNEIKKKHKSPEIIAPMIDPTGAGDAFLSMTLKAYEKNKLANRPINETFVDSVFSLANCFSRQIVQQIGARGDLKVLQQMMSELRDKDMKTLDYFYGSED